jgi:hypothetical protein
MFKSFQNVAGEQLAPISATLTLRTKLHSVVMLYNDDMLYVSINVNVFPFIAIYFSGFCITVSRSLII